MEYKNKGIMFMIINSLCFSMMSAVSKYIKDVPLGEKLFVRSLFMLIVAVFLIKKHNESFKGNNRLMLVMRGAIGFIAAYCYFYSVNYLPLGDATILNKLSPFFVIILSAIFLGEKIHKHHLPILVIGLAGSVLVLKPGFNYNLFPAIMGLLSSAGSGTNYTIIRDLRKTDTPSTILLYFSGITALGSIPMIFIYGFRMPSTTEMIALAVFGLFASVQQVFLYTAFRYAPAAELSVFDYTSMIFSMLLGLTVWTEIPDLLSLAGSVLIIIAAVINYRIGKKTDVGISSTP
jgi:drug/metabolite transporter (DMT)-like permease